MNESVDKYGKTTEKCNRTSPRECTIGKFDIWKVVACRGLSAVLAARARTWSHSRPARPAGRSSLYRQARLHPFSSLVHRSIRRPSSSRARPEPAPRPSRKSPARSRPIRHSFCRSRTCNRSRPPQQPSLLRGRPTPEPPLRTGNGAP